MSYEELTDVGTKFEEQFAKFQFVVLSYIVNLQEKGETMMMMMMILIMIDDADDDDDNDDDAGLAPLSGKSRLDVSCYIPVLNC